MGSKYDTKQIFDKYKTVDRLTHADIFHLYDTGKECKPDNSGYHDSRHFTLWIFNTCTMEKCDMGRHDGISAYEQSCDLSMARVYADGSFMLRLTKPAQVMGGQNIYLK